MNLEEFKEFLKGSVKEARNMVETLRDQVWRAQMLKILDSLEQEIDSTDSEDKARMINFITQVMIGAIALITVFLNEVWKPAEKEVRGE